MLCHFCRNTRSHYLALTVQRDKFKSEQEHRKNIGDIQSKYKQLQQELKWKQAEWQIEKKKLQEENKKLKDEFNASLSDWVDTKRKAVELADANLEYAKQLKDLEKKVGDLQRNRDINKERFQQLQAQFELPAGVKDALQAAVEEIDSDTVNEDEFMEYMQESKEQMLAKQQEQA